MQAWHLKQLGDPIDELELVEDPDPTPGAGQVTIAVESVGLAFPDVLQCHGKYQVKTPPRFTPGGEFAGSVVAVGEGVDTSKVGYAVGDRVVAIGLGGLAQRVNVVAHSAFKIPDGVSCDQAAALPINYCTTYHALYDRAHLQPGETLLITGAAGGTGTAAIQLGQHIGAKTIAVVGGDEKAELVRSLGADVVIDHQVTPDWVDIAREASGGGVDVAYDAVGGETFHQVRRSMGWGGRLLVIGFVAGIPEMATNHILLKSYSVVGVHWGAAVARDPGLLPREMNELLRLTAEGAIDPPLYPPYPFEQAARALQDIAERKAYAKVIVHV